MQKFSNDTTTFSLSSEIINLAKKNDRKNKTIGKLLDVYYINIYMYMYTQGVKGGCSPPCYFWCPPL